MPLTPEDVANKQFTSTRLKPGYDETEVDEFLDEVEAELTRLYRENDELRSKLSAAGRGGETAPQAAVAAQAPAPAAPDPAIARENDELRQKLAAAQRQLAEAANRPQSAAQPPAQPAAPRAAGRAVRDGHRHPRAGAAHRRRAHRRGPHPGGADHQRGQDASRPAQARGRGQAPPDDRLAGDRAVDARARGREAPLVRAGVPQPAQVLPRGSAARARRSVDRRTGRWRRWWPGWPGSAEPGAARSGSARAGPAGPAPGQPQGQRSPFAPGAPVGGGDQPSGPPQQPQGFTEG